MLQSVLRTGQLQCDRAAFFRNGFGIVLRVLKADTCAIGHLLELETLIRLDQHALIQTLTQRRMLANHWA